MPLTDKGSFVTINAGAGKDFVLLGHDVDNVTINAGSGNDSVYSSGDNVTINAGTGNDFVTVLGAGDNVIQYESGDGNDTIFAFNGGNDTLQITKGSYKVSVKNNDVIVKVGSGSITLKNAKGTQIPIKNSKGKVTTKTYGKSSSKNISELFAENNFVTSDNLSEIVENNLTPTSLEKIDTNNFESLTQENNLITYSAK